MLVYYNYVISIKGVAFLKKIAIIYGELRNGVQKNAVEVLSHFLLDYSREYPGCTHFV